jgi:hypothetical protein
MLNHCPYHLHAFIFYYKYAESSPNFVFQATLVRHQRYECGISASYPCALCGRKFKRRDVLKGHMEKCANKSTVAHTSMVMGNTSGNVGNVGNMGNMGNMSNMSNMGSNGNMMSGGGSSSSAASISVTSFPPLPLPPSMTPPFQG